MEFPTHIFMRTASLFNAIFDNAEGRWKAAQFGDLKRDGYFFEGVFPRPYGATAAELNLPIERRAIGWKSPASINPR